MENHNAGTVPSSPQDSDSISTSSAFTNSSPNPSYSSPPASNLSPPSCAPTLVCAVPGTSGGAPSLNHPASAPPAKKPKKESQYEMAAPMALNDWDPMRHVRVTPASVAMSRIKKDLQEFHKHPPEGIYLLVRDEDISCLDVLIVGPNDTPYQGGFFHFYLSFSEKYPFQPPRVRIMTTGSGTVRFNPNFYKNGMVCLSILGTWSGPQWNASQTVTSVLCSIQSLMSEEPCRNEPGFEGIKNDEKMAVDYRFIIKHETLRVAVCDTVEGETTCPKPFVERVVKPTFLKKYQSYLDGVNNVEERQPIDMFGANLGPFSFTKLGERLRGLKAELIAEPVDTAKKDEDFRVLGTAISDETSNSRPAAETTSKRTPWMDYAQHSSEEPEWDFDDIFDEDDEDDGEDDLSDLSDFQDDDGDEGEGGGATCDGHDIGPDNNNEGEDARVAGGKEGTKSAGETDCKKAAQSAKERNGQGKATDAV